MRTDLAKKIFVLILIVIFACYFLLIYRAWFLNFGILTHGDWTYYYNDTLTSLRGQYFSLWLGDTGFGRVLVDVGQAPSYATYGFLAHSFGLGYAYSERFINMWPTAILNPLGSFLLIRNVFKDTKSAIVGAIFFSFNTYFIGLQTGHLTLATAFAVSTFAIYFYLVALDSLSLPYTILSGLTLAICAAYEPRSAYIVVFVFAIILLSNANRVLRHLAVSNFSEKYSFLKRSTILLGPFIVLGALNLYWVVGLAFTGSLESNEIISRGLFGNSYYDLRHALAAIDPYWSGHAPTPFIVNPIPIYYWAVPIFALLGLIFNRKNKKVLTFALVALMGVVLSKQVDEPIKSLFPWLYEYFPGFNVFREASKFYYLIALGYAVLTAAFAKTVFSHRSYPQKKLLFIAIAILPVLIPLYNTRPLLLGDIGTLFVPRKVPTAYNGVNKLLANDKKFSRSLWMPISTRWTYSSDVHPFIHAASAADDIWRSYVGNKDNTIKREKNLQIFKTAFAPELLQAGAIRYLVVPPRQNGDDEDLYEHHGYDRGAYVSFFTSLPYLKHIIPTGNIDIFENRNADPYISASEKIYTIDAGSNLESSYTFLQQLHNHARTMFRRGSLVSGLSSSKIKGLFESLGEEKITGVNGSYSIAKDSNRNIISLAIHDKVATLSQDFGTGIKLDEQLIPAFPSKQVSKQVNIAGSKTYLGLNGKLYPASADGNDNLGVQSSEVGLYQDDGVNLLKNSSFEKELWQSHINDCNNYDAGPAKISMAASTQQAREGSTSLQLKSGRHTACTQTSLEGLQGGHQYRLGLSYKLFGGREFEYNIKFNNGDHTEITKDIEDNSREWIDANHNFSVPLGANKATLTIKLMADDRNQAEATGYFDSVSITPLKQLIVLPMMSPDIKQYNLPTGNDYNFRLAGNENTSNIIDNPSFETGSWQKSVGDCDAYDNHPSVRMYLDRKNHSDGGQSIALQAERHTACITKKVPVKEMANYKLNFDYQSSDAKNLGYSINFDDPYHNNLSEDIEAHSSWQQYSRNVSIPYGTKFMYLTVYGYPNELGAKYNTSRYDNFKLTMQPGFNNTYYLSEDQGGSISKPRQTNIESSSPTKKVLQIKGATTPFYLNMAEAYHPQWQLEMNNKKVQGPLKSWIPWIAPDAVAASDHYKLDDFANGWYVDVNKLCKQQNLCHKNADGSYDMDMQVEFTPQRWFYVGSIVSGVTLLGCLAFLGVAGVRKFRRRKGNLPDEPDERPKPPKPPRKPGMGL